VRRLTLPQAFHFFPRRLPHRGLMVFSRVPMRFLAPRSLSDQRVVASGTASSSESVGPSWRRRVAFRMLPLSFPLSGRLLSNVFCPPSSCLFPDLLNRSAGRHSRRIHRSPSSSQGRMSPRPHCWISLFFSTPPGLE